MNVPLRVAARLSNRRGLVLLNSARDDDGCGRWSFVACEPVRVIESRGEEVILYDRTGSMTESYQGDPLEVLQTLLHKHRWKNDVAGPVPLAMGYMGYDLGRVIEPYTEGAARPVDEVPDLWFGLYDAVWRFDEHSGQSVIVGRDAGSKRALAEAIARGDDRLGAAPVFGPLRARDGAGTRAPAGDPAYRERVERILEYIRAGDVYQVNLARRLEADVQEGGEALALYQALARHAPSAFGAFLSLPVLEDGEPAYLISGSPERFLAREPGSARLETRPIKGTRRRTGDAERDRALAQELAGDDKERAEHLMIVDLERNDLSRVAEDGSVTVEDMSYVVELPQLYHMVSRISCQVRPGATLAEILRATFPGGSITGAPKIRAMEIIDELEPTRRGPYTGAIGYIGLEGVMDFSIAIRTALLMPERLVLHVGGGIVADSTPERELEETEEKAAGWRAVLEEGAERTL